ncbi:MAG: 4-oxalocrotonate tautomerase family protein [Methylococcales bacterium]|nr:4-oxalocrotonate tautomerase family protein [Methylococcales bacterium]
MPYVNIKVIEDVVTQKQKQELIKGVTLLLQNVLNKTPKTTIIVIDEINADNWGIEGETITNRRNRNE